MKIQIQVTNGNTTTLSAKIQKALSEAFNKNVRVIVKK